MANLKQNEFEKDIKKEDPAERAQLEGRFKQAITNLGSAFALPPTPEPPVNLFPPNSSTQMMAEDRKALWQLQQDVATLKEHYDFVVKVFWRTSAVLLGLATPLIGSDLLARLVGLLGG